MNLAGGHLDVHFPDHHGEAEEDEADGRSLAWAMDNVELRTVGVDIGSSTSHLLFSHLHLQRLAQSLSSRFVVVEREILHRSAIRLTPFDDAGQIDADELEAFVEGVYREAGLTRDDVDTGAVILTGLALERRNARAIADLFARVCGGFVCASAGHNLEAILAAHGSGAVRRSLDRPGELFLHLDVGGGTTKLALVRDGAVLATAAVACGGRLVDARTPAMVDAIVAAAASEREPLLLTEPLPALGVAAEVTFSGGVAEYIYGRETRSFGDSGPELGAALAAAARAGRFGGPLAEVEVGIRATVIGASQFTVQLSGSTVHLADRGMVPLRNVPVADARAPGVRLCEPDQVEAAVSAAVRRLDLLEGEQPVAVALRWEGEPRYAALRPLARGLAAALTAWVERGTPVVLALDADVGRSLGAILVEEFAPAARLVALDGLDVRELDYLDVGEPIFPSGVVPVIVKSLAF